MPLQLPGGLRVGAAGRGQYAVLQAAVLRVGRVEAVQLLFQLAELILQVEEEPVVERLEAMGLAERVDANRWTLQPGIKATLDPDNMFNPGRLVGV